MHTESLNPEMGSYRRLLQKGTNFLDAEKGFQIEVLDFVRQNGLLNVAVIEPGKFIDDISEGKILLFQLDHADRSMAYFREIKRDGFRLRMTLYPDGSIRAKSVVLE